LNGLAHKPFYLPSFGQIYKDCPRVFSHFLQMTLWNFDESPFLQGNFYGI